MCKSKIVYKQIGEPVSKEKTGVAKPAGHRDWVSETVVPATGLARRLAAPWTGSLI